MSSINAVEENSKGKKVRLSVVEESNESKVRDSFCSPAPRITEGTLYFLFSNIDQRQSIRRQSSIARESDVRRKSVADSYPFHTICCSF